MLLTVDLKLLINSRLKGCLGLATNTTPSNINQKVTLYIYGIQNSAGGYACLMLKVRDSKDTL